MFLLQYFKNAEMREASRKTSAQRQYDPGVLAHGGDSVHSRRGFRSAVEISLGIAKALHKPSLARGNAYGNEAEVPAFRYSRTLYRFGPANCAATANSTSLLYDWGLRTIVGSVGEAENRKCSEGSESI